jgi:hypothetical protein
MTNRDARAPRGWPRGALAGPGRYPPDRGERPKRAQKNALSAGPAQPIGVED